MRKNKLRALALAVVITLFAIPVSAEPRFTDIDGHPARDSILALAELDIIKGRDDGLFDPNGLITRAEMCVMVNNAFGFARHEYISFDDISPLDFYYLDISIAICAGYLTGYDDNTVRPSAYITRAEAAVIYSKLAELEEKPDVIEQFWDSYAIPEWAAGYIGACVDAGIMHGYADDSFLSGQYQTRAEAAASIYAAMFYTPTRVFIIVDRDYGPDEGTQRIDGDVMVTAGGITLQNLRITGDLIFSASIGIGRLKLRDVQVEGDIYVMEDDESGQQ